MQSPDILRILIYGYGDIKANFISKQELIKNKRALGRAQDLADIEKLEKI